MNQCFCCCFPFFNQVKALEVVCVYTEPTPYEIPLSGSYEGHLYTGPRPTLDQKDFFKKLNIQTIVNLEEIDRPVNLSKEDFEIVPFPIEDGWPPTSLEDTHNLILRIQEARKTHSVYMHCRKGLGRTGTLVACCLIEENQISAAEAIVLTREVIPKSIQYKEQEDFIHDYEKSYGN